MYSIRQMRQLWLGLALLPLLNRAVYGTVNECRHLLITGQYQECLTTANEAIERRAYGEDWPLLKLLAQRELGQPVEALATANAGIERYPWSIRLHYEAYTGFRDLGRTKEAAESLRTIDRLATGAPWRYSDADDLVALGNAALAAGADPKAVLEGFFDRARRNFASRPDGVIACSRLAIEKGDLTFAVELLTPAVEQFPEHPTVLFEYSRAIRDVNAQQAEEALEEALKINPHFTPALLSKANQQIDQERFNSAAKTVARIRDRNPYHPEASGLLIAIHTLLGQSDSAEEVRSQALHHHQTNPAVDCFTGATLSRRYRFREGAALQRKALENDPEYQPARAQLAQDLLRLGQRNEGWQLAETAHDKDGYDTQLFNLLQLRDSLDRFDVIRSDRFEIHMSKTEASIYGTHAQRLLNAAWDELTQRYSYEPADTVIVEIYDRPDDFAVRTFGLPDVAGFLGVCFGRVITANSPVSRRANPTNWESVLWHEFCHVITLQMTGNRIPRWLSEGISVYEERRQDPRWGQEMSPAFRDRILQKRITPVNQLSSAFLNARSSDDINFAYYQSSMVVEYFVERFGHEQLLNVLHDLNNSLHINDALERHSTDLVSLNEDFTAWLTKKAERFAVGVSFDNEDLQLTDSLEEFRQEHPDHYPAGLAFARQLMAADPDAARTELQRLIQLFPEDDHPAGARIVLSQLLQQQGKLQEEAAILNDHLKLTADDIGAATRLFDISVETGDFVQAVDIGRMILAIDPSQPSILRSLADVAIAADETTLAEQCLRALIELDSSQAPRWRYRIAQLLKSTDIVEARRQVLLALEETPRFREGLAFLLELEQPPLKNE